MAGPAHLVSITATTTGLETLACLEKAVVAQGMKLIPLLDHVAGLEPLLATPLLIGSTRRTP